ncbi:MAG: universal stress protein [Candidatus Methanofastidiosia archaeon]|jgi:universal stress protein G
MKILICIRKSECRYNALVVGGKIASATTAEVTILYVLPDPTDRFEEYFQADIDENGRSLRDRVEESRQLDQRLFDEAQEVLSQLHVKAEVKLRHGDPVKEVIKESTEGRYDIIVIGSRALSGIRAKLESLSERIVGSAQIPVLVASCVSDLSSLLLCVEGTEESKKTIEFARDFATALDAHVTVLTVAEDESEFDRAQKVVEYAEKILKEGNISVDIKILVGDPITEIEMESVYYDLVLVGSHKFGVLDSILMKNPSLEIVESSKAPTLVVRKKA